MISLRWLLDSTHIVITMQMVNVDLTKFWINRSDGRLWWNGYGREWWKNQFLMFVIAKSIGNT